MEWSNQLAIKEYNRIEKKFGPPTAITKQKHGIALWIEDDLSKALGEGNCFNEIVIRDESVDHFCPKKHKDFIYSTIKVRVKPDQIPILFSISGSVSYDPLKNLVSARCGSIEANIATLKLVTDLLLEKSVNYKDLDIKYKNLEDVHATGSYGKLIGATSDVDFAEKLYDELLDNVNKLKKKLNKGFWKAAFSYNKSDGKCYPPDKPNKIVKGGFNSGG